MSPQLKDALVATFILLCFGTFFLGAFFFGVITLSPL